MSTVSAVIIAVAEELAKQARSGLPELLKGEEILKEWLDGDIYYRTTNYQGKEFLSQYNLRQKTSQRWNTNG
jgi:hypothetical protein